VSPRVVERPWRRSWLAALVSLVVLALASCGPPPRPLDLPAPVEVTSLGVGDVFEIRVVGEEKLPVSYTVAPDGTIDFPYIKRIKVEGLEPQEVQRLVRDKLIEKEIWTDPNVTVNIKEYNSKRIEVIGEVQHPGSFPMASGMTLLRAISVAGGFNALAKRTQVTIRRRTKGGTRAATVSVEDIIENRIPDPPLQAGDSVNVPQKVF
jgi:protein involved in polysaccharide export with SLBB domain